MKAISISVSGSGQVSDELASDLQTVLDALKQACPNQVSVSLGVTDVVAETPTAPA